MKLVDILSEGGNKKTQGKVKVRRKGRTAPGTPGASFVDLGTKYERKPKYTKKDRKWKKDD